MPMKMNLLVEGPLDEAVAVRTLAEVEVELGTTFGRKGADFIRQNARTYYRSRTLPLLTLVDFMDTKKSCAAVVASDWLASQSCDNLFRVVVNEIESWILADRGAIASFLVVPLAKIPMQPELLSDPKQELVGIARKSRSKKRRDALVPEEGSSAVVGKLYTATLTEFVRDYWRPCEASKHAPSLARCLQRLAEYVGSPACEEE